MKEMERWAAKIYNFSFKRHNANDNQVNWNHFHYFCFLCKSELLFMPFFPLISVLCFILMYDIVITSYSLCTVFKFSKLMLNFFFILPERVCIDVTLSEMLTLTSKMAHFIAELEQKKIIIIVVVQSKITSSF